MEILIITLKLVKNLNMTVKVIKNYYIKRRPKLMKNFSKELEVARELLKRHFNEAKVDEMFSQMKNGMSRPAPNSKGLEGLANFWETVEFIKDNKEVKSRIQELVSQQTASEEALKKERNAASKSDREFKKAEKEKEEAAKEKEANELSRELLEKEKNAAERFLRDASEKDNFLKSEEKRISADNNKLDKRTAEFEKFVVKENKKLTNKAKKIDDLEHLYNDKLSQISAIAGEK